MTDPTIKNSAIIIRVMCAIFFLAFSFAYLYYYQADVLAVAQHILSGGRTCYNQTIGAVLITFVLFLLHWGMATLVRLPRLLYAQTYFFPLLLLLFLTELRPDCNNRFAFGIWFWLLPLLLILHGGILWIFHQMKLSQDGYTSKGFFSRTLWVNLLQMVIMSFLVGQIGAGNDVFHYRAKAERALMKNDYTTAVNRYKSHDDSYLFAVPKRLIGRATLRIPTRGWFVGPSSSWQSRTTTDVSRAQDLHLSWPANPTTDEADGLLTIPRAASFIEASRSRLSPMRLLA